MKLFTSIIACVAFAGILSARPINQLPMYGGQHEPSVEINPEFSRDAALHGWKAFYQGDFDTAMMRFNQAWLFDQANAQAYWGFGLVEGKRAGEDKPEMHLKGSIHFLERAHQLEPENGKIIGDLAYSMTLLGRHYQVHGHAHEAYYANALQLYATASELNPEYPPIWATWSVCLFYRGDYAEAKAKADHATSIGYRFGADFIEQLNTQLETKRSD